MQANRLSPDFPPTPAPRSGFTLLELGVVILILALLATLATTRLRGVLSDTMQTVAEADMAALRDAFVGGGDDGAPSLVGALEGIAGFSPAYLRPANLLAPTNLVGVADRWLDDDGRRGSDAGFASRTGAVNPEAAYADFAVFTNRDVEARRGWGGPYLHRVREGVFPSPGDRRFAEDDTFETRGFFPRGTSAGAHSYGVPGEPSVSDPWGNPYVLQIPPAEAFDHPDAVAESERFRYARLVSAGPDGVLSTPCFSGDGRDCRLAGRRADGTSPRGDDIVLFLLRADIHED